MKKVIAYTLHEHERKAVDAVIHNPRHSHSFVIGELTDDAIEALRRDHIIIEVKPEVAEPLTPGNLNREALEAAPPPPPPPPPPPAQTRGWWEAVTSLFRAPPPPPPPQRRTPSASRPKSFAPPPPDLPSLDPNARNPYLIVLKGPMLEEWRQACTMLGVDFLEYIPQNAYTALLTDAQLAQVKALPFVERCRYYNASDTKAVGYLRRERPVGRTKGLFEESGHRGLAADSGKLYDIRLHTAEHIDGVRQWLVEQGAEIVSVSRRKLRVRLPDGSPVVDHIAYVSAVAEIQEYVEPTLFNDRARALIGLSAADAAAAAPLRQTGEGEIIAIADSGLDDSHPDFRPARIVKLIARARPGDTTDFHGHGTHVAGSALGEGMASEGEIRGTAPAARLVFQSIMDASGRLTGLPADLGDMFEEAYQHGARIHNNSWGADTESLYTFNSVEVDEFVWEHRDMLVVIAAGNNGVASNRFYSAVGFVDWLSIGSPATAKNALTVGASRSDRKAGGFSTRSYGGVWTDRFPDPPIAAEPVSGDPEAIAGFSGRGPCDDWRIKPDLVAPGTDVLSTRSAIAPDRSYWGPYNSNPKYGYMGGTSMATPLVSGCAALVRQYYVKERGVLPSAALLKATLINGTVRLTSESALADHPKIPNVHQGFGRIHMPGSIPNPGRPKLRLAFVDGWQDAAQRFMRTGDRFGYRFQLAAGEELRVCLSWIDPPGRGVQNLLALIVEHPETRKKWIGNADRPNPLGPFDPNNNVQIVRLDQPPPGDYIVQVFARNLLRVGQDFALVVTGNLSAQELDPI
ncbi:MULTISPECIES: S8 family serine peptidase [Rhodomicrobium]|uniref:S8 family serine peptidase n=1 Tax=Rhodomicrobium TaxID=1068 RepID=UPI000B4AF791|nr:MULTISPECIES: S8 family serine peptidase [Rhodomicrobium]